MFFEDDEDIIMPDESVDIPTEETSDTAEGTSTEGAENNQENQLDAAQKLTEEAKPEDEDKKIIDFINGKNLIKFNGESVSIKDINDLVTNYQKGLNYDKVASRDKDVLDYIKEKASAMNLTTNEYIARVKQYELDKRKEAQEQSIKQYMNQGIDEQTAREIVQTKLAREEFEKEKAEYQQKIAEEEKKQKEDAEYVEFINSHPDIKPSEIPKEVFEEAKNIGLNAAYNKYENKVLKEKIKQMEQNIKNASSSPVGLTSDGSPTEQMSKDAFLEGFDSVI